jgi:ribonuclease VapC
LNKIVFDSSAVLAMILKEPGGERVETALDTTSQGTGNEIAISSVNWCEVLTKLQRGPALLTPEELAGILSGVEVVPFEQNDAELAAQLNLRSPFISLGDRACLSLASLRKADLEPRARRSCDRNSALSTEKATAANQSPADRGRNAATSR